MAQNFERKSGNKQLQVIRNHQMEVQQGESKTLYASQTQNIF